MFTKLRSDLVFLGVVGILFVTGVLDVHEALSGFSSTTVAVVGVMFVVVAGLTYTGVQHWFIKHMIGRPKDYKRALLRLMIPVAALSPFLNTTTVVAMFVSVVKMWSKKVKMKPSQFLIPICLDGNVVAILEGSLDTAAARETEKEMNPLNDVKGKDIIIECTNLEYISSAGLRILLGILQNVEEKGGNLYIRGGEQQSYLPFSTSRASVTSSSLFNVNIN
jgi:anti-anti-sigma factor